MPLASSNTKLVAANIHIANSFGPSAFDWLNDYLAAYQQLAGHPFGEPHRLGVHCYALMADSCLYLLSELERQVSFGGKYWLTEFALAGAAPYDSGAELQKFLTLAPVRHPRIERYYLWTNRSDPSCCSGWPFELVNSNGTLTAMGQVYAAWTPPTVRQAWFPLVSLSGDYP